MASGESKEAEMTPQTRLRLRRAAVTELSALWGDSAALAAAREAADALDAEWRPAPLGRLGRRLLPEIEAYVEFFAIARGHDSASDPVGRRSR
jgi:hypothetical protein